MLSDFDPTHPPEQYSTCPLTRRYHFTFDRRRVVYDKERECRSGRKTSRLAGRALRSQKLAVVREQQDAI